MTPHELTDRLSQALFNVNIDTKHSLEWKQCHKKPSLLSRQPSLRQHSFVLLIPSTLLKDTV